jgi:hypothetical protein
MCLMCLSRTGESLIEAKVGGDELAMSRLPYIPRDLGREVALGAHRDIPIEVDVNQHPNVVTRVPMMLEAW